MAKKLWDENTDYAALMNAAVASGDYREAARNEQLRNQKIAGMGLDYAPTSEYADYLDYTPETDYADKADKLAGAGDWGGAWNALYGKTDSRTAKEADYGDSGVSNDMYWAQLSEKYNRPFTYENAPSEVAARQQQIDALTQQILGREPFSYDPYTDPLYSSYKKTYTREGQRAMQDTIGQAAAMTGGIPSSYAVGAANQANDYYMAQMADVIPQLYDIAYSRWQNEGNEQRQNLSTLLGLDETDYQRGMDRFNIQNTLDRQAKDDMNTVRNQLIDLIVNYGYNPTDEELANAGLTREQADAYATAYLPAGGYRGGGSGGNPSVGAGIDYDSTYGKQLVAASKGNPALARQYLTQYWDQMGYEERFSLLQNAGIDNGTAIGLAREGGMTGKDISSYFDSNSLQEPDLPQDDVYSQLQRAGMNDYGTAYAWLLSQGYDSGDAERLAKYYAETYTAGKDAVYKNGREKIEANGGSAVGLMTRDEWEKRKQSYEQYGTGGAEVRNYKTYAEYVRAYTEYATSV
jgi:hypothetical protein